MNLHAFLAAGLVTLGPLAFPGAAARAADGDDETFQMAATDRSDDYQVPAGGAGRYDDSGDSPDARDAGESARVRFLEGGVFIERSDDETKETATMNSPIFSGDLASTATQARAEFQLADGTVLRLDQSSRLTFLAVPEAGRPSDNTVLQISEGSTEIEARRRPSRDTDFRIDTPSASIYILAGGRYRIDVEGKYGKVRVSTYRGVAEVVGDDGSVILRSGQRSFVADDSEPETPRSFNTAASDEFEGWIADRNGRYFRADNEDVDSNVDEEEIPDPVRPYRSELSYYGQWVDIQPYGLCWVPSVSTGWRPYSNGYWNYGPSGYFWISYDPWGWAPYHYGRWSWAVGRGWCWVPGSVFSGAWVSWYYGPSYVGWCPLDFWNDPCAFRFGFGGVDYRCWNFVTYRNVYARGPRRVFVNPRVVQVEVGHGQGVVVRRAVRLSPRDIRENRITPTQVVKQAHDLGRGSTVDFTQRAHQQPFREGEQEILRRSARRASSNTGNPGNSGSSASPGTESRGLRRRSPDSGSATGREPRIVPRERPRGEGARIPGEGARAPESSRGGRNEGRMPVRPRGSGGSGRPRRSELAPDGEQSDPRDSWSRPTYIRPRIHGPDDAVPGALRFRDRPDVQGDETSRRGEKPDHSLREFFRDSERPSRGESADDGGARPRPDAQPRERARGEGHREAGRGQQPRSQPRSEGNQGRSQPKSEHKSGKK